MKDDQKDISKKILYKTRIKVTLYKKLPELGNKSLTCRVKYTESEEAETITESQKMLYVTRGVYSVDDDESLPYVKPESGKVVFAIKIDCSISFEQFSCR